MLVDGRILRLLLPRLHSAWPINGFFALRALPLSFLRKQKSIFILQGNNFLCLFQKLPQVGMLLNELLHVGTVQPLFHRTAVGVSSGGKLAQR